MGITDGLGGEEVNQEVTTTAVVSGTNVYGTTSVQSASVIGTIVSGGNVYSNADVQAKQDVVLGAGSPFGYGVVIPMTARSNISGGMFVSASGNLAYAAAASTKHPIGMAQPGTNVASGGTVNVVTHGVVPAVAEGTIAVGAPAMMGAGAALNCVIAATAASGLKTFSVLDTAGSEGTVFILL